MLKRRLKYYSCNPNENCRNHVWSLILLPFIQLGPSSAPILVTWDWCNIANVQTSLKINKHGLDCILFVLNTSNHSNLVMSELIRREIYVLGQQLYGNHLWKREHFFKIKNSNSSNEINPCMNLIDETAAGTVSINKKNWKNEKINLFGGGKLSKCSRPKTNIYSLFLPHHY